MPRPLARLAAVALALAAVALAPAAAHAATLLPAGGTVLHGLAAGKDATEFAERTGRRPAVWQQFVQWDGSFEWAFRWAQGEGSRVMLHLSTAAGQGRPGRISPGAIARGEGDAFLVRLTHRLAAHGGPVYLRPFAEMNNCDNAYASHHCSGRSRGRDHSAASFRRAWRRMATVLRGGDRAAIDARLRALRLAPLRAGAGTLPRPRVALVWAPMTAGSPNVGALAARRFWPGRAHVDWVGTSFYSRFPNFHLLEPFYARFAVRERKPFAFAEWALWGRDDPAFVRRLFGWVRTHRRVRMMTYNQGYQPGGVFSLRRYPRAAAELRRQVASRRFAG